MNRLILAMAVVFLMLGVVQAQNITWTWDVPTENADGTALKPENMRGYNVYITFEGQTETVIATTENRYSIINPDNLPYKIEVTAVKKSGVESARGMCVQDNKRPTMGSCSLRAL